MQKRGYRQMILGKIIRVRRKELGLTLERCGKKVGVSRQAIHQIEIGRNKGGNDQRLEHLAQSLKLDKEKLVAVRPKRKLCEKKRISPLGEFWTRQRIKRHLTQKQVAAWAGVSAGLISESERGTHCPKVSNMTKIAWALECEIPEKFIPQKRREQLKERAAPAPAV